MKLVNALGLLGAESIAFTGAGGKTSAMFALAQDIGSRVVLTTTTHLGAWQAVLADDHRIINTSEEISAINFKGSGTLLLTGPAGSDGRLSGLDHESLALLRRICEQHNLPMLIEADGARQRSLKAPAAHEPVIPEWVDIVVVMAGLGALGEPLDADSVHRPEIFAKISGLPLGELIKIQDVVAVLGSDSGGLKGIPDGSQRILFLNQAEGPILMAKGGRIARHLMDAYDKVIIGSLHQPGQNGPVFSVQARTAGIILAAGSSDRLGRPKQLLSWQGKPFIHQVVVNALEAGLMPLTVVTGADHDQIAESLESLPVKLIHNQEWALGQSSSMKIGLPALPDQCDSVMFLLSDQPQISPHLIRQLIERYAERRAPITAPMAGGKRGNPVVFNRATFEDLMAVEGDKGGRAVFNKFKVDWLPWIDTRVLLDVDVAEDFTKLEKVYFPNI